jgi:hypothetical protein
MKALRRQPQLTPISDLEIVTIGGKKVLAKQSNSTETSVALDFASVQNELSQIAIIAKQKWSEGLRYEVREIRQDFNGKRVLDFALDRDLEAAATGNLKTSVLAAQMIARPTGLSPKTVLQYAKRPRVAGRNQRTLVRRTTRK